MKTALAILLLCAAAGGQTVTNQSQLPPGDTVFLVPAECHEDEFRRRLQSAEARLAEQYELVEQWRARYRATLQFSERFAACIQEITKGQYRSSACKEKDDLLTKLAEPLPGEASKKKPKNTKAHGRP